MSDIYNDVEVIKFFETNGFTHSLDFSRKTAEYWNEFYLDGKLICQIDQDVPLASLIGDLKCWKDGKQPISNHNYKFNIGSIGNEKILFDNLKI